MNTLGTELGHGRGATDLELALLLVWVAAASSGSPLVARIAGDGCE